MSNYHPSDDMIHFSVQGEELTEMQEKLRPLYDKFAAIDRSGLEELLHASWNQGQDDAIID